MTKENVVTVSLDEETFKRLEMYWHNAHFSNRAEALRVLIKTGLAELEMKNKKKKAPTEKQIEYVKILCKKKNIAPPAEWSLHAYSKFIDEQKGVKQ